MLLTISAVAGVALTENTIQNEGDPVTAVSRSGELGGGGSRMFPNCVAGFDGPLSHVQGVY